MLSYVQKIKVGKRYKSCHKCAENGLTDWWML